MRGYRRGINFGSGETRALSQFVAVTARPPIVPAAPILALLGACLGFAVDQSFLVVGICAATGYGIGVLLLRPSMGVVERLDQERRAIGLDRALGADQREILEPAAQLWERIDNAMLSDAWRGQPRWHARVTAAARKVMERIVVAVLRGNSGAMAREELKALAAAVDRVSAAMGAYERIDFDSPGAPMGEGMPEIVELVKQLETIEGGTGQ